MKKRKLFTEEEMALLRQNPFTLSVSPKYLYFTKEFKELFVAECQAGKVPKQILTDCGYDLEILGDRRIWSISRNIRMQQEKFGEIFEGRSHRKSSLIKKAQSEKDELDQLRHEVEYLRQENDFLKKVSSIRNTRK